MPRKGRAPTRFPPEASPYRADGPFPKKLVHSEKKEKNPRPPGGFGVIVGLWAIFPFPAGWVPHLGIGRDFIVFSNPIPLGKKRGHCPPEPAFPPRARLLVGPLPVPAFGRQVRIKRWASGQKNQPKGKNREGPPQRGQRSGTRRSAQPRRGKISPPAG